MIELVKEYYGGLFEGELLQEISETGILKHIKSSDKMIGIGDYVKSMPLILNGAIRVIRKDDDVGELLLYYLEHGDTCTMTMTCCLGQTRSEIIAIAEVDTDLILIPVHKLEEWLKYKTWRNFVFESYNSRFLEMFDVIDTLAFLNMEERLLKYLQNKSIISRDKTLTITHQEIADDINTSRVVISRILKKLEKLNKVKIHRNRLEVLIF